MYTKKFVRRNSSPSNYWQSRLFSRAIATSCNACNLPSEAVPAPSDLEGVLSQFAHCYESTTLARAQRIHRPLEAPISMFNNHLPLRLIPKQDIFYLICSTIFLVSWLPKPQNPQTQRHRFPIDKYVLYMMRRLLRSTRRIQLRLLNRL